jgi:hypothetical protein
MQRKPKSTIGRPQQPKKPTMRGLDEPKNERTLYHYRKYYF